MALLGAGGMGEVYRARDPKLNRDVAIKVLPPRLSTDPDARARFEREAMAVAALSHPNILAIHDFGAEGPAAFAVMELLDGQTLRERLDAEALPIRKAVQIACDVAQGLAAAHDKGFVHRDLKPENVFLTRTGHVKILDFGLATQAEGTAISDADSLTRIRHTEPGMVLGTVGYMSPEQVRGQVADHRSDIFSLGCILFEMVTGRRAFERASPAETMTAVLREAVPELTRSDAVVPPALDQIVRHCLEKQPAERFQSARDLAFALQASIGASSASGPSFVTKTTTPRSRAWALAAAAVTLLAVGALGGRYVARGTGTSVSATVQPISFQQVSDMSGVQTEPSLSPDGKSVVYAQVSNGSAHLWLQRVGSRTPTQITSGPDDDRQPAFSPDGERIVFRSGRQGGGIFVMNATGESVRRLTDFGFNPAWSPDGKAVVISTGRFFSPADRGSYTADLWAIDVATGQKRQIGKGLDAVQPVWSPHATRIAFWGLRGFSGQRDISTIAADGSATTPIVDVTNDPELDWNPVWSPDGAFIYFSSMRGGTMNLWRVAIDESSGRTRGAPEPVTTPSNWSGYYTFSRDGSRMAFATLDWRSTLLKVGLDLTRETIVGSPLPVIRGTRVIRDHELSPDQQWVAYSESGEHEDILVARTDGSEYRRLTDDVFRDRGPVWSPDGSRIAFYSDRGGSYQIWTMKPDGSGLASLTKADIPLNFAPWAPDGRRMAVSTTGPNRWWQTIDVAGGAVTPPTESMPEISDTMAFWPTSWSPDGRRIVGVAVGAEATVMGAGVYETETRRLSSVGEAKNWAFPTWLPDSRRFVMRDERGIWLVNAVTGGQKLLLPVGGYVIGLSVSVTRDGKWITYTETGTQGQVWLATMTR